MFTNNYSNVADLVKQDILDWISNWVEAPNEFHNYKFAVCPYAKKARLAGKSDVRVYISGPVKKFITNTINTLIETKSHEQMLLIFPPRTRYYPNIKKFILNQNERLIPNDLFALSGTAVTTNSKYPGLFNSGPYFIIGINTLSNVLPAVEQLKSAGYYDNWSSEHYNDIVNTRQKMYEKYKDSKK
jgi:hypothetical protein